VKFGCSLAGCYREFIIINAALKHLAATSNEVTKVHPSTDWLIGSPAMLVLALHGTGRVTGSPAMLVLALRALVG